MCSNNEIFRGQIYWVKLESKDNSSCQGGNTARPCVIVQNNLGNKYSPTTIIAPITSKINKKQLPTHVMIGSESGLIRQSIVLLEQIQVIDKKQLGDYIGNIPSEKMVDIDRAVAVSNGLNIASNPVDMEHINDLIWLINDSTDKVIRFNNSFHIKVRETLIKQLKYYCNSCGIDYEKRIAARIKLYEYEYNTSDLLNVMCV